MFLIGIFLGFIFGAVIGFKAKTENDMDIKQKVPDKEEYEDQISRLANINKKNNEV